MASKPKVEETPDEIEVAEAPDLKDLTDAIQALVQLKIADAAQPKVEAKQEIPETDPATRPDFKAAPDAVAQTAELDARFAQGKKSFLMNDRSITDEYRKNIAVLDYPLGDAENFSLSRYAYALSLQSVRGTAPSSVAPWEAKFYEAHAKRTFVDPVTKAQGDMVSGQDGGFLAPEFWATNFYDQLYASQVVTDFPITTMPMGYRVVHMPKLTGAVTISYASENAALNTTQASFNQLSFTARKQGQIIQISNELIRDSVPAADSILQNHAVRWMALDRDKQLLNGNGQSGAPVGLLNTGGIGITTGTFASAGSPFFSEFVTGIINVETLNGSTSVPVGMANCTGVFGHPILKSQILSMKDNTSAATGRPEYNYIGLDAMRGAFPAAGGGAFDGLLGVPTWRFSNVLNESANSRHVIYGDWQWLVYMVRQDVEIMVSNLAGTAFQNDQTWIRLISRYDVGVAHPEAFFTHTNG